MFEDLEVLAERLLAAAPTEDEIADPEQPIPQRLRGLVDELVQHERIRAASEARSMIVLVELCKWAQTWQDHHDPDQLDELGADDLVAAEIAPALHLAPVTAAIRVRTAVEISTRLPATLAAMGRGDLDRGRVLAIRDATDDLDPDLAARVEARVLPGAVDQTAGELRRALAKAVIAVDPDAAERRRKAAIRDRSVARWTRRDGTGAIEAVLSAIDSAEIYDLIDEIARRTKTADDPRSMGARRSDAFVHLLLGRDPHLGPEDDPPPGPPPSDREPPPDPATNDTEPEPGWSDQPPVQDEAAQDEAAQDEAAQDEAAQDEPAQDESLPDEPLDLDERFPPDSVDDQPLGRTRTERISELAALALSAMTSRRPTKPPWVAINESPTPDGCTVEVGELQGYGPITGPAARHLLETGVALPPPTPSGRAPTAAQAHTHDPPEWLAEEVKARDGTCRYPGCKQPAHRVDLDHTIPFPRGLTVRENLGGLCRRHHRIKGTGAWTLTQHHDGIYEWTSKITGRAYTTYPRGTTGDWHGTTSHQE